MKKVTFPPFLQKIAHFSLASTMPPLDFLTNLKSKSINSKSCVEFLLEGNIKKIGEYTKFEKEKINFQIDIYLNDL